MKVGLFNTVRGGKARFAPYADRYEELELVEFDCPPAMENLEKLAEEGCEAMIYTADHKEPEAFFKKLSECGIRYICCCCAGYDHFDLEAMKKYGIRGANVPVYSPNAISEHTVLLVLAALRHFRKQLLQVEKCCYGLNGLLGRELRNMNVGVVGAGRIGFTTIRCLSGFGPKKIYAYDPFPNPKVEEFASFVPLEELYAQCDVIIYHAIYNESSHHMVNRESIQTMKDGVVLVNTSRGGLFDAEAVLEGIESGKLGGVCLDVIEGEGQLRKKPEYDSCPIPVLGKLLEHDNVIFTSHSAFYTDEADRNLSEGTVENLLSYARTGSCDRELVRDQE